MFRFDTRDQFDAAQECLRELGDLLVWLRAHDEAVTVGPGLEQRLEAVESEIDAIEEELPALRQARDEAKERLDAARARGDGSLIGTSHAVWMDAASPVSSAEAQRSALCAERRQLVARLDEIETLTRPETPLLDRLVGVFS